MIEKVEFGDLATWVGGVATSLAFFVTFLLLRAQRAEFQAAETERREREEDRLKDQARFVSAWVVHVDALDPADQWGVMVEYRNSSEEPIFGCNLYVLHDFGPSAATTGRAFIGVVPPQTGKTTTVRAALEGGLLRSPPVEIGFTDARGRHWRRRSDGRLDQLPENPDDGPC